MTRIDHEHPYRDSKSLGGPDSPLVEIAALERQLAECRAEIVRLARRLETFEKA